MGCYRSITLFLIAYNIRQLGVVYELIKMNITMKNELFEEYRNDTGKGVYTSDSQDIINWLENKLITSREELSKLRQGAVSEPLPLLCTCFRFNGTDSFSGNCNVCGNRSR